MGTIPIGDKYANEDMQRMFELFPRLKERRNQRAMTMSGGEQQMLAIARALMSRPKLLLLDEPSLGLAPIVVKQIFATLRELASTGMTIFLVEQNANHAQVVGSGLCDGQRRNPPDRHGQGATGQRRGAQRVSGRPLRRLSQ
jgi:ABC-type branched-subunit amino acid transport system ATPase component